MKALLLDAGNTFLKWGIGENGEIHKTGLINQYEIKEKGISVLTTRLPRDVDAVMASNVAGPTFATRLAGVIGAHCGRDVHFASSKKSELGLTNAYKEPRTLGVDRWVAMIGAWTEFRSACLVVDAGTAVTIDAIDDDGNHLGGQILPGTTLMASALARETSNIPPIKVPKASKFEGMKQFANSTGGAVTSGARAAVTGAVEHAIKTLRSNAYDPTVVLTGGDASRILQALDEDPLHRPNLVLEGLMRMLESET